MLTAEYLGRNTTEPYTLKSVATIPKVPTSAMIYYHISAASHLSSPVVTAHYMCLPVALHATCKMMYSPFTQISCLTDGEASAGMLMEGNLSHWCLACVLKGNLYGLKTNYYAGYIQYIGVYCIFYLKIYYI